MSLRTPMSCCWSGSVEVSARSVVRRRWSSSPGAEAPAVRRILATVSMTRHSTWQWRGWGWRMLETTTAWSTTSWRGRTLSACQLCLHLTHPPDPWSLASTAGQCHSPGPDLDPPPTLPGTSWTTSSPSAPRWFTRMIMRSSRRVQLVQFTPTVHKQESLSRDCLPTLCTLS